MGILATGIWDEDSHDDELNNKYDEDNDFGLGYLFGLSEQEVTRIAKWVHQCPSWFCSCQEARA